MSSDALRRHGAARGLGNRGDTALHWAAYHGHGIVAELLLQHNADIEAKKHDGPRPWKGGAGGQAIR